jgi:hypothetical protein
MALHRREACSRAAERQATFLGATEPHAARPEIPRRAVIASLVSECRLAVSISNVLSLTIAPWVGRL